tara:strand:+ start:2537 stop:3709 length:1173 start_codon:yes stop_codon:yes gene_type:complete
LTAIKLSSNTIPSNHLEDLAEWLKTNPRLTKDKLTVQFESEFANFINSSNAIFVNSGSSANLLIAAANLHFKDLRNKKVGIPAVSWSTTLSPFLQLGYEPFLLDCDKNNLGIDIDSLYELAKKEDISTLILVHVLGHESSILKIKDICAEFKIRLFEDTCEALGSKISEKTLGSFGLASTFSFYYGHHISTIEGGMICTDNFEFSQIITSLRSHGWLRDLEKNFAQNLQKKYEISNFRNMYSFYFPGYNMRATEINAFLGIKQLSLLDKYCKKRAMLFDIYKNNLKDYWLQKSDTDFISSFAYGTLVENPEEVWFYLNNAKIESRPLICGSMGLQPFWEIFNKTKSSFKNADLIHYKGIYLPINANLEEEDILLVCKKFKEIAKVSKDKL